MGSSAHAADSKRPTLRCIATHASVTPATVSMALRGHHAISLATRQRVRRVAEQLGYKPDPRVARLMHHLRLMRDVSFQSTIAAISDIPEDREPPYAHAVRRGARAAAEKLGYAFTVFRSAADEVRNRPLQRILRSRGVDGVLLLPMTRALSLGELLDWDCFSVVAATHGVVTPDFHRVVPDQFGNTLQICERLREAGCRRIGLVIDERTDLVVGHRFSASVVWLNTLGGLGRVRPLVHNGDWRPRVGAWFARQRPDAIIAGAAADARGIVAALGLTARHGVRFAVTEHTGFAAFGGIDQQPEAVGAAAVAQLHAAIQSAEKGVPAAPRVVTIKGRWVEPRGAPAAAPEAAAEARANLTLNDARVVRGADGSTA